LAWFEEADGDGSERGVRQPAGRPETSMAMMDRRGFLRSGGMAGACAVSAAAARGAPNLVLILADDLGYGDLSCYGHSTIITPHLDGMAREGMRFTQFYSAAPLCGPSRAALMTGRLPIRSGLTRNLFPWSEGGIPDREITVAQMLKKAGFATMCVGKWHLGHLPRYLPTSHGFDDYFGIPYSNDMSKATNPRAAWADKTPPTPLIRGEKTIEQEPDQSLLTRRYTEVATEFIRKSSRAGKPFFLYMPYTAPHWPLAASDRFRGKSLEGLYGDVVEEIDWSVGEILRVLREQKVDRNTLVLFTSDNGAEGGSAGPFRDGKVTTWEGGVRVPCIAWWPGKTPAGVVTPAFGSTLDLFPTFVKLAGLEMVMPQSPGVPGGISFSLSRAVVESGPDKLKLIPQGVQHFPETEALLEMPKDRVFDGEDLTAVLLRNDPGREPLLFYYSDENVQAVRKGRWKLHVAVNNRKTPPPPGEGEPPLLFDVQQDISERRNLARRRPEVVKELLELIERHKASITRAPIQQ